MTVWWDMPALSSSSRKALIQMAQIILETFVRGESPPHFEPPDPALRDLRSCFVTLRRGGELRGCLGSFQPEGVLYEEVIRMTRAAAREDPRFPSVLPEELPEIQIEISVLSPLEEIHSPQEVQIGRHGVLIQQGSARGAFLPEVAEEMQWSADEFVRRCALEKAGLPESALREARLYRFTTEKIKKGEI